MANSQNLRIFKAIYEKLQLIELFLWEIKGCLSLTLWPPSVLGFKHAELLFHILAVLPTHTNGRICCIVLIPKVIWNELTSLSGNNFYDNRASKSTHKPTSSRRKWIALARACCTDKLSHCYRAIRVEKGVYWETVSKTL